MTPAAISLIVGLVQEAIANEPALAADFQKLFAGGVPSGADWAALRATVASENYGQFVPASQLPS